MFLLLKDEVNIVSAKIRSFHIYINDFVLVIEVDFQLQYGKEKYLKLIFSGIKEYAFNYSCDLMFYNVECYKLLKEGDHFYVSFDPFENDLCKMSERDNDMILCKGIEGYFHDC